MGEVHACCSAARWQGRGGHRPGSDSVGGPDPGSFVGVRDLRIGSPFHGSSRGGHRRRQRHVDLRPGRRHRHGPRVLRRGDRLRAGHRAALSHRHAGEFVADTEHRRRAQDHRTEPRLARRVRRVPVADRSPRTAGDVRPAERSGVCRRCDLGRLVGCVSRPGDDEGGAAGHRVRCGRPLGDRPTETSRRRPDRGGRFRRVATSDRAGDGRGRGHRPCRMLAVRSLAGGRRGFCGRGRRDVGDGGAFLAASSSSASGCPGCSTRSSRVANAARGSSRWAVRRRATTSTP